MVQWNNRETLLIEPINVGMSFIPPPQTQTPQAVLPQPQENIEINPISQLKLMKPTQRLMSELELKEKENLKNLKNNFSPFEKLKEVYHTIGSVSLKSWEDNFLYEFHSFFLKKNEQDSISLLFSNLENKPENWKNSIILIINDQVVNDPSFNEEKEKECEFYLPLEVPINISTPSLKVSVAIPKWRKGFIHFVHMKKNEIKDMMEEIERDHFISMESVKSIFDSFSLDNLEKKEMYETCQDGLEMQDEIISLLDPYTRVRINKPIKGLQCEHRQCFDLETFLQNYQSSRNWNCPICNLKIDFHSIRINKQMSEIIEKTKEEKVIFDKIGNWREETKLKEEKECICIEDDDEDNGVILIE
jgi:hypothetical protein